MVTATPTSRGHRYHKAAVVCLHLQSTGLLGYLGRPSAIYTTSARVTRGLSPRDRVRPALKELHWLPVTYCTQYKVALPRFTVHDSRCSPMCLSEYVQPAGSNTAHQRVHSASSPDFIYLRTRTKFGD